MSDWSDHDDATESGLPGDGSAGRRRAKGSAHPRRGRGDRGPGSNPCRAAEIDLARGDPANVIVIGPDEACGAVLALLRPLFIEPLVTLFARPGVGLPAPASLRTLVLHDIEALGRVEQERLFRWVDRAPGIRIVSTTPTPLLPRVERGLFLDALYYRLNTICILRNGDE